MRLGLLPTYAHAAATGMNSLPSKGIALPAGNLEFVCAAHGLIGSNNLIFLQLAQIIVKLMISAPQDIRWMVGLFD